MNRWDCGNLMAMTGLLLVGALAALTGCATPPAEVTPAAAVARLRTGEPLLTCREACLGDWQRAQPQAAQLRLAAIGRLLYRPRPRPTAPGPLEPAAPPGAPPEAAPLDLAPPSALDPAQVVPAEPAPPPEPVAAPRPAPPPIAGAGPR